MDDEEFRIWGRVTPASSCEFVVLVAAVPTSGNPAGIRTLTEVHDTRGEAAAAVLQVVARMTRSIEAQGGRVIDLEIDGA